jgi:hypothetical protein
LSFIETSALDANNVDSAFENVLTDVFNILNNLQQQENAKKEVIAKSLKAGGSSSTNTPSKPNTTEVIQLKDQTTRRGGKQGKCCQ